MDAIEKRKLAAEATRRWRAAHPATATQKAAAVERVRQWRLNNPEKAAEARKKVDRVNKAAKAVQWASANPEKTKAIKARWKERNAEKVRAKNAAWRAANKDRQTETARLWRAANPEASRAIVRNRRARLKACPDKHTAEDVLQLIALQGGKCANCRVSVKKRRHIDHIIPLAAGGSNGRKNLQVLCPECNFRKNALHPITFAQREGRLL